MGHLPKEALAELMARLSMRSLRDCDLPTEREPGDDGYTAVVQRGRNVRVRLGDLRRYLARYGAGDGIKINDSRMVISADMDYIYAEVKRRLLADKEFLAAVSSGKKDDPDSPDDPDNPGGDGEIEVSPQSVTLGHGGGGAEVKVTSGVDFTAEISDR